MQQLMAIKRAISSLRLAAFLAAAVLYSPNAAIAAPSPNAEWSVVRAIEAGRKISVTPFKNQGSKTTGNFVSAGGEALVIQTRDGSERSIPRSTIKEVALKGRRGRKALIGLGIGAAGGFIAGAIEDRGLTFRGENKVFKTFFTVLGAAIGAAVGALWPTAKTIYQAPIP